MFTRLVQYQWTVFSAVFWNGRTVDMRWKHFLEITISPVQLAVRIWWQCLLMGTGKCTGLIATGKLTK